MTAFSNTISDMRNIFPSANDFSDRFEINVRTKLIVPVKPRFLVYPKGQLNPLVRCGRYFSSPKMVWPLVKGLQETKKGVRGRLVELGLPNPRLGKPLPIGRLLNKSQCTLRQLVGLGQNRCTRLLHGLILRHLRGFVRKIRIANSAFRTGKIFSVDVQVIQR